MNKQQKRVMYIEILTSKLLGVLSSTIILFLLHNYVIALTTVGNSLIVSMVLAIGSFLKSYFVRKFFHPLYSKGAV